MPRTGQPSRSDKDGVIERSRAGNPEHTSVWSTRVVPFYDSLGGSSGVATVVDRLYERVMADPSLAPYFAGADLAKLKEHQRAFLAVALGGPHAYAGRSIGHAHATMRITPEAFGAVVGHLVDTLAELGAEESAIAAVATRVLAFEHDVVSTERVPSSSP
jgi:hemoglobin